MQLTTRVYGNIFMTQLNNEACMAHVVCEIKQTLMFYYVKSGAVQLLCAYI